MPPLPKPPVTAGYGMNNLAAAKTINGLAAKNNAAAGTSSWTMPSSSAFPSLKGATGNTLYPPPKPATSSYPSLGSGWTAPKTTAGASSSGGSNGGSLSPAPWQMPSPSWGTSSAAPQFQPAPMTPKAAGSSGGKTPAAGGGSASSFFSQMAAAAPPPAQMPSGFAGPALSQPPQPTAAPTQNIGPGGVQANGRPWMGSAAQSQVTEGPMPGPDYTKSNAGGVEYSGGKSQTHSSVTGPGALRQGVPGAGTKQGVDQWGRTFYYNETTGAGQGQPVAGVSNTGTVLRTVMNKDGTPYIGQDGKPVVYDTGTSAFTPMQQPARAPQPSAPIAVGRPTQTGQPVSIGVSQQPPPPPPPPSQDELDTANQGNWLL